MKPWFRSGHFRSPSALRRRLHCSLHDTLRLHYTYRPFSCLRLPMRAIYLIIFELQAFLVGSTSSAECCFIFLQESLKLNIEYILVVGHDGCHGCC